MGNLSTFVIIIIVFIILLDKVRLIKYNYHNNKKRSIKNKKPRACNNDLDKYKFNWSDYSNIETNNCYSYALNFLDTKKKKLQPGHLSDNPDDFKLNCKTIKELVKSDNTAYDLDCDKDCKCDYHKIYLVLDDQDNLNDYHFYKQNNNGEWSHKPGLNRVTTRDSENNVIHNPRYANRNYKNLKNVLMFDEDILNYNKDCGCMCVKSKDK